DIHVRIPGHVFTVDTTEQRWLCVQDSHYCSYIGTLSRGHAEIRVTELGCVQFEATPATACTPPLEPKVVRNHLGDRVRAAIAIALDTGRDRERNITTSGREPHRVNCERVQVGRHIVQDSIHRAAERGRRSGAAKPHDCGVALACTGVVKEEPSCVIRGQYW